MFDKLNADENIWGIGQKEIMRGSPHKWMNTPEIISKLMANGYFIFRPNTEFTKEWVDSVNKIMDDNYEKLKLVWDKQKDLPFPQFCKEYPLPWAGLQGAPFHLLNYKYKDNGKLLNCLETGVDFSKQYR